MWSYIKYRFDLLKESILYDEDNFICFLVVLGILAIIVETVAYPGH